MTPEESDFDAPGAARPRRDDGFSARRTPYAVYGGPIQTEGPTAETAALASLWSVDDAHARALTHGFHSYVGRMHPTTARRAIAHFSAPGETVLDPFCGGGTTLVEAYAAGRVACGSDVSPLAVRIARVRTTTLDAASRARLTEDARRIAEHAETLAFERRKPFIPRGAAAEFERFDAHVAYELFAIRGELFREGPVDPVLRALRLCLSSILVKCLRRPAPQSAKAAAAGATPEFRKIARGFPAKWFAERAVELAAGLSQLEAARPAGTPEPCVEECDARALTAFEDASASLVVTSPPYAGIYDYGAEHAVRYDWLGLPRDRMTKDQLGMRDETLGGANPGAWIEGRRRWMAEIARVLEKGGRAVLIVGDGVVGSRPEDAAEATAHAAEECGLHAVARASQARPPLSGAVARYFEGRARREHAVLLAKP
jgi:DNA modification methylase